MGSIIVYADRSIVRPGKHAELERALGELAAFVEQNEPGLLAYRIYWSEDRASVTVLHVHRDAESLALHLRVAGPRFRPFAELLELSTIDVYGEVSPALLEPIREKARLLGTGVVRTHGVLAGFDRFGSGRRED